MFNYLKKNDKSYHNLMVLGISILSGYSVYFPITDTDIWWHLASGRFMVDNLRILSFDPFSFSNKSTPLEWVNVHWLYQIGMYYLYELLGPTGLVVFKCGIVSAIVFSISTMHNNQKYRILISFILFILFFEARSLLLVRPTVISILFVVLYLRLLEAYRQTQSIIFFYSIVLLQIIWTNFQGLSILGIAIVFLCGIEQLIHSIKNRTLFSNFNIQKRKVHEFLLSLLFLSTMILTPFGFKSLLFPLKLWDRISPIHSNMYAFNVSENSPLYRLLPIDMHFLYVVIAVSILLILVFIKTWKDKNIFVILLCLSFCFLAYSAQRNIPFYYCVAAYALSERMKFLCKDKLIVTVFKNNTLRYITIPMLSGISCAIIIVIVTILTKQQRYYANLSNISPFRVPVGAVQYLKTHPIPGNIFNSIRFGGYLSWYMYPPKRVFVDGRLIIRSKEFFNAYLDVLDNPEHFKKLHAEYMFSHVLLPTAIFDRYLPLIRFLYTSTEWDLVYLDGESILFVLHPNNTYAPLNLKSQKDLQIIYATIDTLWKKNNLVYKEAYFNVIKLVKFLTS